MDSLPSWPTYSSPSPWQEGEVYSFWDLCEAWAEELELAWGEHLWKERLAPLYRELLQKELTLLSGREGLHLEEVEKLPTLFSSGEEPSGAFSVREASSPSLSPPHLKNSGVKGRRSDSFSWLHWSPSLSNAQEREDLILSLTEKGLRFLWIFLLRLGREAYETLLLLWVWGIGYVRPQLVRSEPSSFQPLAQILDLGRFGLWLGPVFVFLRENQPLLAAVYFVSYTVLHHLLFHFGRFIGVKIYLLPSAWEEIRWGHYRFRRPVESAFFLLFFLAPPVYWGVVKGEWLLSLAYVTGYLGAHFLLQQVGRVFQKEWYLLPRLECSQPDQER